MTTQDVRPDVTQRDNEELADTLIAISVVAKRLATKLRAEETRKGENEYVKNVRTCCCARRA